MTTSSTTTPLTGFAAETNYGGTFALIGNKRTKVFHAVAIDTETGKWVYNLCTGAVRDIGRTEVGRVEGYRQVEHSNRFIGWTPCEECVTIARDIADGHDEHRATIVAEGAAAGRNIRHLITARIVEEVSEEATLYSIKNATERIEHALREVEERLGVKFTVQSTFVEGGN